MSEKNAQLYVDDDGTLCSEDMPEPEDKCLTCDKKHTACVSFLSHENAMMHKDMDNERSHRQTLFVCLTVIVLTLIFVIAYTFRMNSFIDVIKQLTADIVEIARAKGIPAP